MSVHERLRVHGGVRLEGEVCVAGAKNSALKLMAAALLAEGTTVLHSVPEILDVSFMAELLRRLGCGVQIEGETVLIDVPGEIGHVAPYELVRRLRASISVLGPLVARCHRADVALPGGDAIGSRGLDMHVAGLEKLGAVVEVEHGYVLARAPRGIHGAAILLDFPSVGATENLVMAATLGKGTTVLDNVAREPEIVDLCEMLVGMGARIAGIGSSMLEVTGVERLHPVEHTVVPDRIVSGTWAAAAAMTRGDVFVRNANPAHIEIVLDKLAWSGARLMSDSNGFRVVMNQRPRSFDVVTLPYPGFATDLQPLAVAINAVADGTAMVTENVFESRFMFVNELVRLGANVRTDGHHAVIRGRERLSGAPVVATDIRAGAGLVMAGLVGEGETTVSKAFHIDRGYPDLVGNLRQLGATITREPEPQFEPEETLVEG